jgi:hypothetical protein
MMISETLYTKTNGIHLMVYLLKEELELKNIINSFKEKDV